MVKSQIDYAKSFAACEAEDLRFTGLVQAGVSLLAAEGTTPVARTPDLGDLTPAECAAIITAPVSSQISATYRTVDAGPQGVWLRHDSGTATIFERPRSEIAPVQPAKIDWADIAAMSKRNLWKLSFHLCDVVGRALNCERTMVYRFHEDFSGEVIAESLRGGLEPFLGLRYPPTDIPSTARALFLATSTRHIFSVVQSGQGLLAMDGAPNGITPDKLDLTRAMGRSVSPYHLEYLRNMGTAGTAACALVFEGRLWGLLSLHFARDRQPSLAEIAYLQQLNIEFLPLLEDTLRFEQDELRQRSRRVLERQATLLEEDCDPFRTFLVSPLSLHRVLSGQGTSLVIGDEICNVGSTPDIAVTRELCRSVGAGLGVTESAFLDKLPDSAAALNTGPVAGCAITRLCSNPEAFVIVYRNALSQTVSWGGDPRKQGATDEVDRVSPRKSFETWVERVEGYSAPWTESQRSNLGAVFEQTRDFFDISPRELTILIRNGMRQARRKRDVVRATVSELIEGIRTAIAVGVEQNGSEETSVVSINSAACGAFSIAPAEVTDLSVADLERLVGVDLAKGSQSAFTTSIATFDNGIRDCEVNAGLLFEYVSLSAPQNDFRIMVYEFRDVTEARRIEQALVIARDRALRDVEMRSQFFAKLSHELRTPLNAMIGLSTILLQAGPVGNDDRTRQRLEMIHQASQHMSEVIEMALQNAAAVENIDADRFEDLPVAQLVRQTVDLVRPSADARGVAIEIDVPEELVFFCEPRAVKQILLNILSNAIKYNVSNGEILVQAWSDGLDFIRLRVGDTGIGMSVDQVEQCMQPYRRFANGEGAGLGLSIANHLTAAMGGLLTIQSQIGRGTDVDVLLGAQKAAVLPPPQLDRHRLPTTGLSA